MRQGGVHGDGSALARGGHAVDFNVFALRRSDGFDDGDSRGAGLDARGTKVARKHLTRDGDGERGANWRAAECPTARRVDGGHVRLRHGRQRHARVRGGGGRAGG